MRLGAILVSVGLLVVTASASRADFSVGAQLGAGHVALGELEDFWDEFGLNHDSDALALQWEVSATWRFASTHAVRLSVERITMSIAINDTLSFAPPFGLGFYWSDLDFESIPICVTYEFTLRASETRSLTLIGIGAGYYITELEDTSVLYHDDALVAGASSASREGHGYGFHGYLRQTAPISERLSLSGMLRGRWVDGMAFDDSDGDIPVEFTGFDIALGLEWKI